MTTPLLPFTMARDAQVLVEGGRLLAGPNATALGLREARRRAGGPLALERVESETFDARLAALYQDGSGTESDEDGFTFDLEEGSGGGRGPRYLLEDGEEAPVIQLVNQLLRRAVRSGASDLHVEPHENGLRARMRVDGMLQSVLDRKDLPVRRVVSRLKVMAGLDISETRLPQDGHIALRLGGRAIDVRVSTLPGNYGERVVMRVLIGRPGSCRSNSLACAPIRRRCCTEWRKGPTASSSPPGPPARAKRQRSIRCCNWPMTRSATS